MQEDTAILEPLYDVKEIKVPSARRPSQWRVWNRKTRYDHRVYDSEALAWLIAAQINYAAALREFQKESEAHAEGYEMGIEPDTRLRIEKIDAHRGLAQRLEAEANRVCGFDHKLRLLKKPV